MNALIKAPRQSLEPATLPEAMQFSQMLARSTMVPKDFQGKPENILVAVQWGREIGLGPLQALQNIAVINGRPSIWGDAMIALARGSGLCLYVHESIEGEGDAMEATCLTKRQGEEREIAGKFSVADAKKAGLWGKAGPWQQYPKRMLQLRARGFCLRDAYPDVLRGVISAEEARDMPTEPPFTGQTIEAERIPPGQPRETAQAIGDELPASAMSAAPATTEHRRTWADLLDDIRQQGAACATEEDAAALGESADVTRVYAHASARVQADLTTLLGEVMANVRRAPDADSAAEP